MKPNTIAFIIAPVSIPIFAFFTSDSFPGVILLIWTVASYFGMLVFGFPYIRFLKKKNRLTGWMIFLGSIIFGAIYGLLIGFGSFVGVEFNFLRGFSSLFSFFGLAAMLFGALYGGIVGVTFSVVRYAAIKQSST